MWAKDLVHLLGTFLSLKTSVFSSLQMFKISVGSPHPHLPVPFLCGNPSPSLMSPSIQMLPEQFPASTLLLAPVPLGDGMESLPNKR